MRALGLTSRCDNGTHRTLRIFRLYRNSFGDIEEILIPAVDVSWNIDTIHLCGWFGCFWWSWNCLRK